MDQTGKPAPLDVVLKIVAPDFEPKSQTKVIRVPPFADSSPCSFLVTPREVGELCVNIELYLGDISLFSRVLKTHATTSDRVPVQVPKALVSVPLLVRVNNIHDLAAFFHQPLSPVNLTTLVNPPQFPTSAQVDEPVSRPKRSRMAIGAQLAVGALVCCVAITVFTKSIERRTESALPRTSNMQTPASMPMERTETKLPASKTKELEEQFRRAEQAMREHHSEVEHRAPEPVATREQKRETLPRKPDGNIMPTKPSSERPRYTELEHRAPEPVATREQKRETLPPKSHVMVPAEPSSDVVDYHGPVSGEITWTGDVQGTLLITIDNDRANVGTIRGSLPRVPCIFHLLDPEQVTIVSTPSPGRLVLKVEGVVGLTQIVIQWRVKNLAGQSEPPVK
jgi:hypothetical protein